MHKPAAILIAAFLGFGSVGCTTRTVELTPTSTEGVDSSTQPSRASDRPETMGEIDSQRARTQTLAPSDPDVNDTGDIVRQPGKLRWETALTVAVV